MTSPAGKTLKPPKTIDADRGLRVRLAVFLGPSVLILLLAVEAAFGASLTRLFVPDVLASVATVWAVWQVVERVGGGARVILAPDGAATPHRNEYSRQQSLIVKEQFAEAATAFREEIALHPDDHDARLALARLLVDHCNDGDGAKALLEEIRTADCTTDQRWAATNALIDLHRKAGNRRDLRIELFRLARDFPNIGAGRSAAREAEAIGRGEGE